jgi:lysozyme
MITLGSRGAALIKSYETLKLKAYMPTPNDVWTIGYGSTRGVREGMVITEFRAEELFKEDTQDAINAVDYLHRQMASKGYKLTPSMIDALISLVFNVGPSCLSASATIGKALLDGKYYHAWRGFSLWTKQSGKDLLGLARRRSEEMKLFLEDGIPK